MTIREAVPTDAEGIARVHVESWRTTYPGIMPQEHLDELSLVASTETWSLVLRGDGPRKTSVFVAENEGAEIVGFVSGGVERTGDSVYAGEVYALYLLQSAQGQGVGRRLVQTLAHRLFEDGHSALLTWVNARNPAHRFYEALGGVSARTGQREIRGITYDDIGYGWDKAAFEQIVVEKI